MLCCTHTNPRMQMQADTCVQASAQDPDVNVPGCPYGLLIIQGRAPGISDNTIWEMSTHDTNALRIRRRATGE